MTTARPNTCEGGMSVGATAPSIPLPLSALHQS
jgi:hypothetical protein